MHFEITRTGKGFDISSELWRNVSPSPCLLKSSNDGRKDFVVNTFSSVVNSLSTTPVRTNKVKLSRGGARVCGDAVYCGFFWCGLGKFLS